MSKKILTLAALALILNANAQLFNSGFENNNGTPLSSYTKINVDGNPVASWAPVPEFSNEAWIQFYDGYDNKIAFSTSSYDPAGTSNDWLITPSITIPATGNPTLYWKAKSYDFEFMDSYDIKISETTNEMASFTTVSSVEDEQPYEFNSRTLDLSNYRGKTIYIAFVNKTNNGYFLALDDLYVSNSGNCMMPNLSGFSATNKSDNSFTANWSATSGINNYDIGLTNFTTPVTSHGIQSATTRNFTQLEPGTRYQFFLKNADCGSGWAGPKSVFTAANLPYSYDFEFTAENYGEYDSDGWSSGTWINGSGSSAQNGEGYVFNNTSTTFAKNDWIFSYPIKLMANEKVDIKYFAQMGSATASPATLKVSVADAPYKEAIVQELSSNAVSGNTYVEYTSTFTASAEAVYYFGFGNVTAPVTVNSSLRIDNIRFTKNNLAVSDVSANSIQIFPNPVKDFLTIKSPEKILKSELYSIDGKLLQTFTDNEMLNFSSYGKGIYLIKVHTKSGIKTQKIIK